MEVKNDISDIRAEMFLNRIFPEKRKWNTKFKGEFYRNYNNDLLTYDDENSTVGLTRDGFTKLLPQGVLTRELDAKEMKNSSNFKKLERKNELLREAFTPIDNYVFGNMMDIEHEMSELLGMKVSHVLKTYFNFDLDNEQNEYVKKAAVILPMVSKKRGDFSFIRNLLMFVLRKIVYMTKGRYSDEDTTRYWLPKVRYDVVVQGLSKEEYGKFYNDVQPLCEFVNDWLVPFDVRAEIVIRERKKEPTLDNRLILDYNIEVKK